MPSSRPASVPAASSAPDGPALQGGVGAALLVALGWPWLVHALAVLLSALGATPLRGRLPACAILIAAFGFALALAKAALRHASPSNAHPALPPWPRALALALFLAGGAAFGVALLISIALPVIAYDALGYRLPLIAQWLDLGRIGWVQSDDVVRNGYPMGQEAVSAVIAAASSSLRASCAMSFPHVASGALAVWLTAEHCGVRRALGRAAAALFVLAPMTLLNAPSGYVDAAFAGASVALFCTAALLAHESSPDALLVAATGMAAANALSLKGTGLVFVVIAFAAVAVARWWRTARAWLRVASALPWALPGVYWALRNLLHKGNPLWPVSVRVAGHTLLRGQGSTDQVLDAVHNTPPEYVALGAGMRVLRSWLQWSGPATTFDERTAGLGFAWPMLALPAIACFLLRRERGSQRALPVAFVLVVSVLCLAIQPMSWWPRYTLWLWGAGALALALEAEDMARADRRGPLTAALMIAALVISAEGAIALTHAKGAKIAASRLAAGGMSHPSLADARDAINAMAWVSPQFWALGIERGGEVCRGSWKPHTDNANLDGVFAQITPRPRVHVMDDDHQAWPAVRSDWQRAGCPALLLLQGSRVLSSANRDPGVSVERAVAFDPLFVVRPRTTASLGRFEGPLP
ncbi:MAG: hypothetical protein ACHQ53_05900 [Polyangiales bacterium]